MPISKFPGYIALTKKLAALAGQSRPAASGAGAARMAVYLGDHLALTKTIYGHKMYVDTRDISLTPHILLDGCWEQWITNVFLQSIRAGMRVVDIGANLGWYSVLAAQAIGPSGHLTSFEANPEMADILYRNLTVNGLIGRSTVENRAVYSESTTLDFKIFGRYKGSSSIFASSATAAAFHDRLDTIKIAAVSLDDYFAPGSKIDFIRMDIEGGEPFVLQGARRLLSENKNVQVMMEFGSSIIARTYGSVEKFHQEIEALGFSVWRIQTDSTLVASSREDLAMTGHCDVILKR